MVRCFLLGGDDKQAEFLHWMLGQLDTDIPVLIADFGLSLHNKEWLRESFEFDIISLPEAPFSLQGWYLKPFAIDAAHSYGYSEVCWLDNDLQIRTNIDDVFEYAQVGKLAMAIDEPSMRILRPGYTTWNSGVVVSSSASTIVDAWMDRSKKCKERGDQEALAYVVNESLKLRDLIVELPTAYNHLRLALGPNDDAKIIHWTGPVGKKHIREQLM